MILVKSIAVKFHMTLLKFAQGQRTLDGGHFGFVAVGVCSSRGAPIVDKTPRRKSFFLIANRKGMQAHATVNQGRTHTRQNP